MINVQLESPNDWWDIVYALRVLAGNEAAQEAVGNSQEGSGQRLDDLADEIDKQYRSQVDDTQ